MKYLFLFLGLFTLVGCQDNCVETRTFRQVTYNTLSLETIRNNISIDASKDLVSPGKIFFKDDYIFIVEKKEGIHIIDNQNPSSPSNIAFIKIPGVLDLIIKDNTLFADNYTDLVSFNVSDISNVKFLDRLENQFTSGLSDGLSWYYNSSTKTVTDPEYEYVTETYSTNCGYQNSYNPIYYLESLASFSNGSGSSAGSSGNAGSMARFGLKDNYLYTVNNNGLVVYDITNPKPDSLNSINLGWGVETIFPYEDKLFIGSNSGMFIFNNSQPDSPKLQSTFNHARACDPVVVQGDRAYVTLRAGFCGQAPNQLDIIDISSFVSPKLIKSYQMENPHGLSVLGDDLFICEGDFGLKTFDISDENNIQLKSQINDFKTYDIIALTKTHIIVIGSDGLYQYNMENSESPVLLSTIKVKEK